MQISMSNYRSTEASIKNLEIQVGQLAKQMVERPTSSFGANTEKNPKEECKEVLTRAKEEHKEKKELKETSLRKEGQTENKRKKKRRRKKKKEKRRS